MVLDRATTFVVWHGVGLIRIDSECITQNDSEQNETALQSIDLVYSFSKHSLGFLLVPVESQEHLDLLLRLLCGNSFQRFDRPQRPTCP